MHLYKNMPSTTEQERREAKILSKLLTYVVIAIGMLIVYSCEHAHHDSQVRSGNWQEFILFVCSLQARDPQLLQNWDEVEEWLQTAEITLSPANSTYCVSIPATFDKSGTKKGDFEKVVIEWQVKSYSPSKHVKRTRAIPTVQLAGAEVNWDSFKEATWSNFPYEWGTEVGRTMSIEADRSTVFAESTIFHSIRRLIKLLMRNSAVHNLNTLTK
jgi:hypothetical protein